MCKPDAGASPLFPPQHPTAEAARRELADVVHRAPRLLGLARSRWWLDGLRQAVPWLQEVTVAGVHHVLARLGLTYKRGRVYVHSPDPLYDEKLAVIQVAQTLANTDPQRFVLLYEDELTYYRRATVAQGYALRGSDGPYAQQGYRRNAAYRIAGCLNYRTGQLVCWQRAHFDRHTLIRYYTAVQATYPDAERIFIAQDNWPVHFHEDILTALADSKIVLVPLPTYAPWTNPIEKVWRKLYQELLHLHDFDDRWSDLKQAVAAWLAQFRDGSFALLRYVGLYPD
jgi:hypothetical protein